MITSNEEFLESRRMRDFKGPYTQDEEIWWMKQQSQQALERSAAYSQEIRAGFPPGIAAQRVIEGQKRFSRGINE
jgi:hypothetical protein